MIYMSKLIHLLRISLTLIGAGVVLFLFLSHSEKHGTPLMDYITQNFYGDTGSQNAIVAIFLNYRVFDTFFEGLMLMVSVMEVINVSWANIHAEQYQYEEDSIFKKNNSEIVTRMLGIVYPFILLLGLYIMVNGHAAPGGGYQGGSILATALISRYLVYPNFDIDIHILERLEKILFLSIIAVPVFYLFFNFQPEDSVLADQLYLILMNCLIGIKVFSGLSIIFYRFVFFEGR